MKAIAAAAVLAAALIGAAPSLAAITGPVRIQSGMVTGISGADPSVVAFKGLPYAAPPVGDLRWKPPQPPVAWQGVRAADHSGPDCPEAPAPGRNMSEDCLTLDLWTGAKAPAERRPVMVWFHGGDGYTGTGTGPQYDGEALARKGVVVVTLNFRGGPLGFLATPELSRESGHNASSDYGIMDDIAALKWVQKNIAAFGGDPDNVTLFGQSAGAGLQHLLSLSPQSKGLFKRMITQSHARYPRDPELYSLGTAIQSLKSAEAVGVKFQEEMGAHNIKELRQVPVEKLIAAFRADPRAFWHAAVDGWVIPHGYNDTYELGGQQDVLVITGDNKDESGASPETAFDLRNGGVKARTTYSAPLKLADYIATARKKYGPLADEFLKLYPATSDREAFLATDDAARDNARVSSWMWAGEWRKKATKPVYIYFWTHAAPGPNHDLSGASHGSEIAYVFGHPNPAWTDDDRRISDAMATYWTNFAKTGNPNGPGVPQWTPFDAGSQQVMEVGDHFQPIPLADKAKVDFWKRYYDTQPPA